MSRLALRIGAAVAVAVLLTAVVLVGVDLWALRRTQAALPAEVRPRNFVIVPWRGAPTVVGVLSAADLRRMRDAAGRGGDGDALAVSTGELRGLFETLLARRTRGLVLASAVAAAVGVLVAAWLSRRIALPVSRVSAAASRVAAGDLSARVALPSYMAGAHDETARLAHDFNAMAESLERLERERSASIADIAHELRTPLTIVRGRLEAVEDGIAPLEMREIRGLHAQVVLLGRLVEDLRTLSSLEAGRLTVHPRAVDVSELLRTTVDGFRTRAEDLGVDLDTDAPEALVASVDRERIGQVIGNLIDNALRHAPRGGRVRAGLEERGEEIELRVTDTGPGIPPEERERVFERFYRVEKSRGRAGGGSGLGLAIVKALVGLHGGRVTVGDGPEGGAAFTVTLPRGAQGATGASS